MKGLKIITIRAWNMKEANTLSQISEKTGVPFIDNQRILTEAISFGADEEYFQWMINDDCRSLLYHLAKMPASSVSELQSARRTYFSVVEAIRKLCGGHHKCIFSDQFAPLITHEIGPVVRVLTYSPSRKAPGHTAAGKERDSLPPPDMGDYDIILNMATVNYDKCAQIIHDLAQL